MAMKFIDISGYQRGLDIPTVVKNGGLGAVVVKATEGIGWVDKSCDGFVQQCLTHGIPFGFYHFARNNNAASEAEYFRNNTKGYERRGIPILDWEDGQSVAWVNQFVEHYHALTGIWPWVYGNAWRFNQGTVNPNCGRWIAGYPQSGIMDINFGMNNPFPYAVNGGGVCAWQFTSCARIAGYGGNLDGDVFYGDAASWAKYAGGSGTPSAPMSGAVGASPTGSTLELAVGVMQGRYGNGNARKAALGVRYDEVQAFINHIQTATTATLADEVKSGKYGNGDTRKIVLGARYGTVQSVVNGTSYKTYKVQAGDTLSGIAAKYGTTYQRLAAINGIRNPNIINVGQVIKIF